MALHKQVSRSKSLALKTMQARAVTITLVLSWIMMSLYYYNIFNIFNLNGHRFGKIEYQRGNYSKTAISNDSVYRAREGYLIDTPGCAIPDYSNRLKFKVSLKPNPSCGIRAVNVKKVADNTIEFTIDQKNMGSYYKNNKGRIECSYRFAIRSTVAGNEDTDLYYTPSKMFQNGTRIKLEQEVITVSCYTTKKRHTPVYEDSFMILKKVKKPKLNNTEQKWNVLLIGMDTMSRGRVFSTMPATVKYLQRNSWLDYRGYQKVGSNTFPNLVAVLTGKNISNIYSACGSGMSSCNDLMIWSWYQHAGYATAFGEDHLRLPDTFYPYKGFKTPPTDHYMRPLFLTKETDNKGTICTKKFPSGKHILNYAADFANSYKHENFFGFFWMNSYSHNSDSSPGHVDKPMVDFFNKLNQTGVLKNTFVIFFSDHGIRYGVRRVAIESYYAERLPMMFIWVPEQFRSFYPLKFASADINQYRLTTNYDLHMTLVEILRSLNSSVEIENSEVCPECSSFFHEKSAARTCADAKVDEKWCSCHNLGPVKENDADATQSLNLAVSYIQKVSQWVETTHCKRCHNFTLKTVLRKHSYKDYGNKVYYVVAFVLNPGEVAYEANIVKEQNNFKLLLPIETITGYNARANCVKQRRHRGFCVCTDDVSCK